MLEHGFKMLQIYHNSKKIYLSPIFKPKSGLFGEDGWWLSQPNDFQTKRIESGFTGWPQLRGVNTADKFSQIQIVLKDWNTALDSDLCGIKSWMIGLLTMVFFTPTSPTNQSRSCDSVLKWPFFGTPEMISLEGPLVDSTVDLWFVRRSSSRLGVGEVPRRFGHCGHGRLDVVSGLPVGLIGACSFLQGPW